MKSPYSPHSYKIKILTPVYIGGAKENDYYRGIDYFFNDDTNEYWFVNKNAFLKGLTNNQANRYSNSLSSGNTDDAERFLSEICESKGSLIQKKCYCPFKLQDSIRKHITSGAGSAYIPGSSLKGALRSCLGKHLMKRLNISSFKTEELFGSINNNFMKLLQVTDIDFKSATDIIPFKVFSGDVAENITFVNRKLEYEGTGMWKRQSKGGHVDVFEETGFVTLFETLRANSESTVRLNCADGVTNIWGSKKPVNYNLFSEINGYQWMKIARDQMNEYLDQEIIFFKKFPNNDFVVANELLEELKELNNYENSVIIKIGQGSGFHAITGNWKYKDHTQTGRAIDRHNNFINAINYKTRKVAFKESSLDPGQLDFMFPGFVQLSF
ncbi:type III-A CRISPR-associated RAMP protein Csm5 [Parafilimonas sp.]|uniref:type III-A CRISPR-associated RAMP protein Csm5 n=1 Tax=Parafilimonas sp. TaxID=1969739 RepID=UPI0039E69FEF